MKICLVTGVTGLIGSALIKSLCDNYFVYGISKSPPKFDHDRYKHIEMDLCDQTKYKILPDKVDYIFHLAQSNNFRDFPNSSKDIFDVNIFSTFLLLEYARKISVKSFIVTSSGGIYGYSDHPFSEDDINTQQNKELGFYLGTKMCSEILSENYVNFMNVIILRPFFVYGSEQSKKMLIPRLIQSINNGVEIKLQGENGISINPLHVFDAVKAIENTLNLKDSLKINIAGKQIVNLREIGNIISKVVKKDPIYDIDYSSKPKNIIADTTIMEKLLVKPEIDIEKGIFEACKGIL